MLKQENEATRQRIIKRILRNSIVYTLEDLKDKSVHELKTIQEQSLINLNVKVNFKKRHEITIY